MERIKRRNHMRAAPATVGIIISMALGAGVASSAPTPSPITVWFEQATMHTAAGKPQPIAKPDFLCGTTFKTMCKTDWSGPLPDIDDPNLYNLASYDRKHHLAFAFATTDQRSEALFAAPPPPVAVPDADLSGYATGRGIRVGSPYSQVLAVYGPPVKHGDRFVTSYSANDITTFEGHAEQQPERITLVIDHGRVSSIVIDLELFEP
jgi:hypothetical protein